jgi:hypothetical protein
MAWLVWDTRIKSQKWYGLFPNGQLSAWNRMERDEWLRVRQETLTGVRDNILPLGIPFKIFPLNALQLKAVTSIPVLW